MKIDKHYSLLILIFKKLLVSCQTDKITLCGNRCSSTTPWKVENLDLGLPCFATKEACVQWSKTHGYYSSECVKCN
jgi:hypothetical protein